MDRTDTTAPGSPVGQVLDGRYRVDARVADGGMATVYRALDVRLDRVVALKVMHPNLAADPAFVDRFIREARSTARLDHPNVVAVWDQGADGHHVYLAMEYVPGCTLREVLRGQGALQPRAALDVLEPILAALGAAHRAGMVHRDMKPENVLIGDDGRVKVADFGLVRAVDSHQTAGTDGILGTVSYLAPEQIEEGRTDPRTDLYACGVVLYEMLTGAKPHTGGTAAQVLYRHLHEDVPAPSGAVPGLAPELDALVARATARDSGRRPKDAAALLAEARVVRAALSDAQLDAVPPAAATTVPGEEHTRRVDPATARTARTPRHDGLHRTSRLTPPPAAPPSAPPARSGGRRLPRAVLTVLAVLFVALLGTGVWYVGEGQFTRTPAVLDRSEAAARATLRDAGLDVRVRHEHSLTVDRGRVVSSDPGPGERVRGNGTVTLTVSDGPPVVTVPDVAGDPLGTARRALEDAGLEPGTVEREYDDRAPRGTVVGTDPGAGTERRPGSAVTLVVSRGAATEVPDVVGEDEDAAHDALREAGLRVRTEAGRVHAEQDPGEVARQSPEPGGTVGEGETVTLTLSEGPDLVDVPDVEDLGEDEARDRLESAGFEVTVRKLFFGETVWRQDPGADEEAPRGSTVVLWVR